MLYSKLDSTCVHCLALGHEHRRLIHSELSYNTFLPFSIHIINSYTQGVPISLYESPVLNTHHIFILFITKLF